MFCAVVVYKVMAYIAMVHIVTASVVMACIVMTHIVMAHINWGQAKRRLSKLESSLEAESMKVASSEHQLKEERANAQQVT